jgi:hypothetical protein|tara:strand:- start:198 stop:689 length:492 start_codon:yes stop_codon:yes gene_type:complete
MIELDILMVIAEVAVAIAGFSAVVANFSKNWSAQKGKQLHDLLYQSGIVLFASLVPLIMSQQGEGPDESETLWAISSAMYIFFALVTIARDFWKARKSGIERRTRLLYASPFFLAILALAINIYLGAEAWLYLLALLLNLAFAFYSFVALLKPLIEAEDSNDQ